MLEGKRKGVGEEGGDSRRGEGPAPGGPGGCGAPGRKRGEGKGLGAGEKRRIVRQNKTEGGRARAEERWSTGE